ncbi:hypothetical protein DDL47_10345 [Staphylococcus aureus]|uniref:Uncharacterized protein n=1 Tax=Staphylococcus aureus TaxID=1280 RepID=A0AAX2YYK4_STAAU|nr:hypothetical protein BSG38_07990 [Staphylococcus aureus]EFT85189.1 hypothetical protein CGSSa03_07121 [Staphylococcus aureus subsp. aureus CGS03]OHR92691.1 hypothetical protein HMPREF3243_06390 [Staphylococcus sp. HMSC34H10]APZ40300.1 hypothetical protein BSG37_07830 [Staphylococcus aureus]AVT24183.1 hypothetical protein B6175_08325 [Staphylococcus aureus]
MTKSTSLAIFRFVTLIFLPFVKCFMNVMNYFWNSNNSPLLFLFTF